MVRLSIAVNNERYFSLFTENYRKIKTLLEQINTVCLKKCMCILSVATIKVFHMNDGKAGNHGSHVQIT